MSAVLLLNAASALVMTGVIWFVQVVHYPLFDGVGARDWPAYHARHTARTGYVVIGPMVVELATSALLVASPPAGVEPALPVAALALTLAAWALTLGVATRDHRRLSAAWDAPRARRLVTLGWGRTAAWTLHAAVALAMLSQA